MISKSFIITSILFIPEHTLESQFVLLSSGKRNFIPVVSDRYLKSFAGQPHKLLVEMKIMNRR